MYTYDQLIYSVTTKVRIYTVKYILTSSIFKVSLGKIWLPQKITNKNIYSETVILLHVVVFESLSCVCI